MILNNNNMVTETTTWRMQIIVTIVATMAMVTTGLHGGWSSSALPKLYAGNKGFNVTSAEGSWMASLYNLGMIPGCLYTGYGVDHFGRRVTLLSSAIPVLIGWVIIAFSRAAYHIYIARIIAGIGFGTAASVCAIYVGEISEKSIRGGLSSVTKFMLNFGALLAYIIGPSMSFNSVVYVSFSITAAYLVVGSLIVVESPYYYMKNGDKDSAKKVLMRLRGVKDSKAVEEEYDSIEKFVKESSEKNFTISQFITDPLHRKTMAIVLALKTLQQLTGYQAIMFYLETIFSMTSMELKASVATIIYGAMQVLAGVLAVFVVDRFGRKPTLYFSLIGIAISLSAVGGYFFVQDYIKASADVMSTINWLPLTGIILFCVTFNMGVGPLVYVLEGELFTNDSKGPAVSFAIMYGGVCTFASAKLYQVIADAVGVYVSFWVFAVVALFGIFFVYFCLPETKGKTFAEIQMQLSGGSKSTTKV